MNKGRALKKLYAEIPRFDCLPGCADCCGKVPMTPYELSRLVDCIADVYSDNCPIVKDGKCGGYEDRPFICRLFGTVERMKCPHGAGPEKLFTEKEEEDLFLRYEAIRGNDRPIILVPPPPQVGPPPEIQAPKRSFLSRLLGSLRRILNLSPRSAV